MKHWFIGCALLCATSVFAGPEWVRGEITKLAPEKSQLTLRHEAIKSIGMDAMTMPYRVSDRALLQGFRVGDAVHFSVKTQNGQLLVDALEHAQ